MLRFYLSGLGRPGSVAELGGEDTNWSMPIAIYCILRVGTL